MGSFKVAAASMKCYSDASQHFLAAKANGRSVCGPVPPEYADSPIEVKEALALEQVVNLLTEQQMAILNIDNSALHGAFQNKRSRNQQVNEVLKRIFQQIKAKRLVVQTRWISTEEMQRPEGADQLSRNNLQETYDKLAMSPEGVRFVEQNYGKIHVDVFSGPLNNPFQTKYCSAVSKLDDQLSLKEDGFTFLTTRKLTGRLWLFPPIDLTMPSLQIIRNLKWPENNQLQILLVLPDHMLPKAILFLRSVNQPRHWVYLQRRGRSARYMAIKVRSRSFVIISIGNYVSQTM